MEDGGFKCLVILQKGTNAPIEKPVNPVNHEDRLIMACNKWAFGHKDSSVVATRGGFEGILGENTAFSTKEKISCAWEPAGKYKNDPVKSGIVFLLDTPVRLVLPAGQGKLIWDSFGCGKINKCFLLY